MNSSNNDSNDFLDPAKILGSMKRPSPVPQVPGDQSAKKSRLLSRPAVQKQEPMRTPQKTSSCKKKKDPPKSQDVINTTPTLTSSPSDIYDAMMGEISDLLQAAQEAQALGRIKMASTYQLLAHTRLVGLGKRFDGFLVHGNHGLLSSNNSSSNNIHNINNNINSNKAAAAGTHPTAERSLFFSGNQNNNKMNANAGTVTPLSKSTVDMREAHATLAKILPLEVDLDNTMMEHLARAAMELHNKRTGKGMLHEKHEARKTELEYLRNLTVATGHPNSHSTPRMAGSTNSNANTNVTPTAPPANSAPASKLKVVGGVAWTDAEKRKVLQAAEMYGAGNVEAIAAHVVSRNVAEVRAHLLNMSQRGKVERQILAGAGVKKDESDAGDGDGEGGCDGVIGESGDTTMPSARKGRGKKPPSKAMLTVPNGVFDAKKMVGGQM